VSAEAIGTAPHAIGGEGVGRWGWAAASLVLLIALGGLVRYLDTNVPKWFPDLTWVKSIEFPVYAIAVGLIAGAVLGAAGLRQRLGSAFRTEFLIKTGLVLLGASINLGVIARAAGPAIVQSVVLISTVFLVSWWIGGRLGPWRSPGRASGPGSSSSPSFASASSSGRPPCVRPGLDRSRSSLPPRSSISSWLLLLPRSCSPASS
jgi:hypothetical protein